jgi:hypothetical protein
MIVTVMYRNNWFGGDGWTFYPVTIEISNNCPKCGGPRGEPVDRNYYEDDEWYCLSNWVNPCGHVDYYGDVLVESGYVKGVE